MYSNSLKATHPRVSKSQRAYEDNFPSLSSSKTVSIKANSQYFKKSAPKRQNSYRPNVYNANPPRRAQTNFYYDSGDDDSSDRSEEEEEDYTGEGKCYGRYRCKCGNYWESANCWVNYTQDCKKCRAKVFAFKMTKLLLSENKSDPHIPHPTHLCGKCRALGRSCVNVHC